MEAQLDAFAQAQGHTPGSRAYQSLRRFYAAQAEQEAQSIERVRQRLAAWAERPSYPRAVSREPELTVVPLPLPGRHPGPSTRTRALLGSIAAVLVLGLLMGSYVALLRPSHDGHRLSTSSPQHPWQVVPSPNTVLPINALSSIALSSSTDAWAVGTAQNEAKQEQSPIVEYWNGEYWQLVSTPALAGGGSLADVVSLAPDNAWAVGEMMTSSPQALIEHWNGHEWTLVPGAALPTGLSGLTSLVALSADNIWAVGWFDPSVVHTGGNIEQGLIEHWDGQRWQVVDNPSLPLTQRYLSVAASAPDDVWAVGEGTSNVTQPYENVVEHWDGQQWKMIAIPNDGRLGTSLTAVAALSANNVWVAGVAKTDEAFTYSTVLPQQIVFEHWDGRQWTIIAGPHTASDSDTVSSMIALGPADIWAVGRTVTTESSADLPLVSSQGMIEHWDGQHWSQVTNPQPQQWVSLLGIARDPSMPGRLWVVGSAGLQGSIAEGASASTLIETNG